MASCNSNSESTNSSPLGHINNPKRSRRVIYCPHCSSDVPKSTYYRHRAEFYDEVTEKWLFPPGYDVSTDSNTLSSLQLSSQGK